MRSLAVFTVFSIFLQSQEGCDVILRPLPFRLAGQKRSSPSQKDSMAGASFVCVCVLGVHMFACMWRPEDNASISLLLSTSCFET